jgi:hypothetical protein
LKHDLAVKDTDVAWFETVATRNVAEQGALVRPVKPLPNGREVGFAQIDKPVSLRVEVCIETETVVPKGIAWRPQFRPIHFDEHQP